MRGFKKYSAENQPRAWLFLAPSLLVIGVFNIYPLLRSFWMSFQGGSLTRPFFNGIENYKTVLMDSTFHKAMKNTALYAFTVVPISLIISMDNF